MVFTRYLWRPTAGEGLNPYNDNRRLHIFVVDLGTKQVKQLTSGTKYEHSIDWSPDGSEIPFFSDRDANSDEFFHYDVFALRVADGSIRRLTASEACAYVPVKFADPVFGDQDGNEGWDVLYGVNAACQRYLWIDRDRMGIEGVSYGGRYMAAPFQVEMIGSIPAKAPPPNPEVAKGKKVFEDQGCSTCHGEGAVGTAIAPKLIGVVQRLSGADKVASIIHNPPPAISKAGMSSFNLTDAQMKSLIAYLVSLH
jgi:mono/diheme cytochrome c family protein